MEWVPDKTGHFYIRPLYSAREIDEICGSAIVDILKGRYGNVKRAVADDDLIALIESQGASVELDVEFCTESAWIQGETEFRPDRAPCIRIARGLPENRKRSTIPHEGGHLELLKDAYADRANVINWGSSFRLSCADKRAEGHNWLEWQADECSGALLIPSPILEMVIGPAPTQRHTPKSLEGASLIAEVSSFFRTSCEFATVRLLRLGYLRRPSRPHQFEFLFDALPLEA